MKRQVITIQEDMVIYAPHHGEVWMTVWEIAELLNITGTAVKNTIKRIWKQSVLKDFQHSQYVKLENGYSAHVYDMEVIIAIALQMDTYQALLFITIIIGYSCFTCSAWQTLRFTTLLINHCLNNKALYVSI